MIKLSSDQPLQLGQFGVYPIHNWSYGFHSVFSERLYGEPVRNASVFETNLTVGKLIVEMTPNRLCNKNTHDDFVHIKFQVINSAECLQQSFQFSASTPKVHEIAIFAIHQFDLLGYLIDTADQLKRCIDQRDFVLQCTRLHSLKFKGVLSIDNPNRRNNCSNRPDRLHPSWRVGLTNPGPNFRSPWKNKQESGGKQQNTPPQNDHFSRFQFTLCHHCSHTKTKNRAECIREARRRKVNNQLGEFASTKLYGQASGYMHLSEAAV